MIARDAFHALRPGIDLGQSGRSASPALTRFMTRSVPVRYYR